MKLGAILRFELAYQVRRPWPWLAMAALILFAMAVTRVGMLPVTLPQDFVLNSPFISTTVTVLSCQIWLLVAPAVAGEAAARDVHTGIQPLVYTSPVGKAEYLGGRFLAALSLNALILLGVQAGSLLAVYAAGTPPEAIGPFRPAAYLAAFGLVALPNALIATTIQFAAALGTGRPMAAYVGSFGLFFLSYPVTLFLYISRVARPEIALLTDPIGVFAIMNEMMTNWTIAEKNVRMFALEGHMLWNRLLWVGVSLGTLAFTYRRFRFAHRTGNDLPGRLLRRISGTALTPDTAGGSSAATSVSTAGGSSIAPPVPAARRSFGFATRLRQMLASTLATTLDLYRELQAVTPDSLKPLLHDLFEVNTIWRFDTKQATAVQTNSGVWRVTFEVEAHKFVADSAGAETEVPMAERVEIGVFAPAGPGEVLGRPLYVQKHRIRSGTQTITVTVPETPARGGIDPYNLLDWEEGDNIEAIEIGRR